MAATPSRPITSSTAAAVERAASNAALGKQRSMKPRHWASACGMEEITFTSSGFVPGRASNRCSMGRTISLLRASLVSWMRTSSVSVTEPSRLFSIGTIPSSAMPESMAAATALMLTKGRCCASGS